MKRVSQSCALSESLVDWRYCVGQPCCCLSCLSKSWEDHFIIVCLPCLTLLSRREPLGKWGLAAVFAVCSVFTELLAWLYQDCCCSLSNCLVRFVTRLPKTRRLASCGITHYDSSSRPQWCYNKATLWGLAAFTQKHMIREHLLVKDATVCRISMGFLCCTHTAETVSSLLKLFSHWIVFFLCGSATKLMENVRKAVFFLFRTACKQLRCGCFAGIMLTIFTIFVSVC